jgi:phosphoribosylanthranilate isomerase
MAPPALPQTSADYYLLDSGAGSGKAFDWAPLAPGGGLFGEAGLVNGKPWFLAGGVNLENIDRAVALAPFCVDASSGAETDGMKDREKIKRLVVAARIQNR